MNLSQKMVWNLYSAAIGTLAAIATKKAVDGAWAFVTGEEPPEPNDPRTPASHALVWVVAVSLGVGLSQVLVNRLAARQWERFTGAAGPIRKVSLRL